MTTPANLTSPSPPPNISKPAPTTTSTTSTTTSSSINDSSVVGSIAIQGPSSPAKPAASTDQEELLPSPEVSSPTESSTTDKAAVTTTTTTTTTSTTTILPDVPAAPRNQQNQPDLNAKGSSTSSSQHLTTVSEDFQLLASGVREKASAVLSSFGIKAKSSANSLRPRAPQSLHLKAFSTSTFASSRGRQADATSSPSEGAESPASSISQDDEPAKPLADKSEATLERPSVDVRLSERASSDARKLARPQPSPTGQSSPSNSMIAPHNKMHQTSSRLLRMTDEERPFTRDFKDLFSTLMVSLPLSSHRVRFQKIDHTFTSEEAINNLGSLKFSQSNRMPDPKDPSRIVTTTTTTTFSMAKEMARSVCQRFMDARFIEAADGKSNGVFPLKGALWQMTPKGMHVLQRFCQRNGINQRHVLDVLDSLRNTMQLVILERDPTTDKLSHDRATVEVLFRRFAGQEGPNNIKSITSSADSDSVSDYYNGTVGVKMAKERDVGGGRKVSNTFTGKATVDWLLDCCTTVDRRETYEVAELFCQNGLIYPVIEDKVFGRQNMLATRFQPTKDAIYALTEKGQKVAGWIKRTPSPPNDTKDYNTRNAVNNVSGPSRSGPRDSNNNRLNIIVNDAALRLLFREYLRDTHCEENLSFYLEVREFTKTYDISERAKAFTRLDAIRENLAAAYGLYNAFLAPGSPCELNIDHNLRNSLAGRMTRAVGDDNEMLRSLQDVVTLFKDAQQSVFKLMSSDSVPKFLKEPRYVHLLREHNFDPSTGGPTAPGPSGTTTLPDRTLSKHARDPRAPVKLSVAPEHAVISHSNSNHISTVVQV